MDKAQPILDQYPPNTVQLSWIMGHDTMTRLFDPKYYNDVHADMAPFFEKCDVICSSRPGYGSRDDMMRFVEASGHGKKVTLVEIPDDDDVESTGETQVAVSKETGDGIVSVGAAAPVSPCGIQVKEVSSTMVRSAIKSQEWTLVDRCVPTSVRQLIERNGLYTD